MLLLVSANIIFSKISRTYTDLPISHAIVAEKLKNEGRQEVVAQETMEEVEDEEGNVYNRKTYEDLKRQGLI